MRKIILVACICFSAHCAIGQRTIEGYNTFEFETSKDNGNRSFIKYSSINLYYNRMNYTVDSRESFITLPVSSLGISFEGYNTLGKRIAGSSQFGFSYFNGNYMLSLDYGLYFILLKGLYIKPYIGYAVLSDAQTSTTPYVLSYGGDAGYYFSINKREGSRPFFIGAFASYKAFTGTDDDYDYSYVNTFSGGGFGAGIKMMWGPRQR